MGTSILRKWECDNCGLAESFTNDNLAPKGWAQMRWNDIAPLGAMDANGWCSLLLCSKCFQNVRKEIEVQFTNAGVPIPRQREPQFRRT